MTCTICNKLPCVCHLFEPKPDERLEEFFGSHHAELDAIMMNVLRQVAFIKDAELVKNKPKPDEWFTEERIKGAIAREEVYKEYNESLKPEKGRLLTDEDMLSIVNSIPGRQPGEDYSRLTIAIMNRVAKAQRDLTASIKDKEYKKERLEYVWLVTELRNALAQKEGVK